MSKSIPRSTENDYSPEMIEQRQSFIEEQSGARLEHARNFSFDPASMSGNVEGLVGVAQIPVGLAGPVRVNGEYAQGEFYVPLATVEGTLVASYSRGMKVINACGGVKTTVSVEAMQRAPTFIFNDARGARDFGIWLKENFEQIKAVAESTTSVGKLTDIDQYQNHNMLYTRFNYYTGDAAGQNMTGKATFVACEWINKQYPDLRHYMLSGNFDTEKKTSAINGLKTRGKRVTAELTIPGEILQDMLNITPQALHYGYTATTVTSLLAGSSNNAAHPANGLAALYIATGQDAANIGESNQCTVFNTVNRKGELYYSITLPSIIVATYGGGTGLSTQREFLEIMDCYGQGKAKKLAEIAAATVVAGELSLMAATRVDKKTRKSDWVDSHEQLGRNR